MCKSPVSFAAAAAVVAAFTTLASEADDRARRYKRTVGPFVERYCSECHGAAGTAAGFDASTWSAVGTDAEVRRQWLLARRLLRAGIMPPAEAAQPAASERAELVECIDERLRNVDCRQVSQPGRVTLRRLNRAEYRNTVLDLLGVEFRPASEFPVDDVGYGFDNNGDVLALSPVLMEKYLAASEEISRRVIEQQRLRRVGSFATPRELRALLEKLVRRAYRRPPQVGEVERLVGLVEAARHRGETLQQSVQLALQAVLVSPHFLFLVEADPPPGQSSRALNDHELAARLSYFLWSSMPDAALRELAEQGLLKDARVLAQQVARMLADEKSRSLVDNFATQWLQLRKFAHAQPDRRLYPEFTSQLRRDMRHETEAFFHHILRGDRSVLEFLDCDYVFVNERLARHYGIGGVRGDALRKVTLSDSPRGGLLAQASMLTLTSNATRTSPVKRGKWILENLLDEELPPAPPNVPSFADEKNGAGAATLRQRLEQHRSNPACVICHQQMDGLGFALENFDAVGGWRMFDGAHEIDPSGRLPGSGRFHGPSELKRVLLGAKREQFLRCLSRKLLTYALGRGLQPYDACAVTEIVREVKANGYRFSALVQAIVRSDPFQNRGTQIESEGG